MTKQAKNNSANLGFEGKLWAAADKLRGSMEPSDYKHVTLGLIFLKYISDAFEAKRADLLKEELADPEDPEEYLAENIFWVPKAARWPHLQARAKQPTISKDIDNAMLAIEASNASLKGVLPKDYARPALNKVMLGELIDLVSGIGMAEQANRSRDILGRVYEYFLGGFAGAEGKRGGEFYTPSSVVRLLVEMLEPYRGRIYDPCCGSGGMFVQSERFVEAHGGRIGDIAIYGQESNYTTWRLAKMNLAVRGIDADIRWNNEGSFHKDELPDLKADFILANPPFNVSDWGGDRLREDARWRFGTPPISNANFAWLQHIFHHLAPLGAAGVVLANGSLTSNQSNEGDIRRNLVKNDAISCIVSLPNQLFYSTQIPASLWFLVRNKTFNADSSRMGQTLMIDARTMGTLVDRTRRELSDSEVAKISACYRAWLQPADTNAYRDTPGFCKSVTIAEIERHRGALVPGRFV
ncbi:MAG: SAM-dependent DNA methyltransferase, partial [Gammaproteobacteria bacterium]|nr:SAM-dependent DNA methyltransferase [Gammaproteobacteria bacterium]